MDLVSVTVVTAGLLLYALISGRLQGTIITAPLVFVIFGFGISESGFGIVNLDVKHGVIHFVAEFTLILVLFTDAARIDLKQVRQDHNLPLRMLVLGLPLAIVLGALVAVVMFPAFSFWEVALLAALLAPTDAALGQSVVSAKIVPSRIRQAINVESGLNDGIALPAVLLFAALAGVGGGDEARTVFGWLKFGVLQVTLGPIVGIAMGYAGGRLLDRCIERGWTSGAFQGIAILTLAVLTYMVSELVGGNGFIATFVGGMMFGASIRHACDFLLEFMETEGQLFMLITFLIFGAILLPEGLEHVTPMIVLYALLSLTIIRMLPISLSLMGTKVRMPTSLFLGWFGPRGLASILFLLVILEDSVIPNRETILTVTVITVALSVLLHGISAAPFANSYGKMVARVGECEETQKVGELPLRVGNNQPEGHRGPLV